MDYSLYDFNKFKDMDEIQSDEDEQPLKKKY